MNKQSHIVITGASSGIGAELAQALAAEGHALYLCARRAEALNEITRNNTLAFGFACDVSCEEQVKEFVSQIQTKTPHVDALINCAGGFGAIGIVPETDSREWLRTIEVNLYGTYLMTKHIVPLMVSERHPRIINFSGGGAFSPFPNYSAYAVSKAAVVRLTENLALELGPLGITVNAVAPGFVVTQIHQATLRVGREKAGDEHFEHTLQKLSEGAVPIEVPVACVCFLLSEQARGLTGKTISASFDPWASPVFQEQIPDLNQSELYTMRRINLVNLSEGPLRTDLSAASDQKESFLKNYLDR